MTTPPSTVRKKRQASKRVIDVTLPNRSTQTIGGPSPSGTVPAKLQKQFEEAANEVIDEMLEDIKRARLATRFSVYEAKAEDATKIVREFVATDEYRTAARKMLFLLLEEGIKEVMSPHTFGIRNA